MLDESAGISGNTGPLAQRDLQRGKGADPPAILDRDAPYRSGNVEPDDTPPSERDESANDYEDDERCVEQHDSAGKPVIDHSNRRDRWRPLRLAAQFPDQRESIPPVCSPAPGYG